MIVLIFSVISKCKGTISWQYNQKKLSLQRQKREFWILNFEFWIGYKLQACARGVLTPVPPLQKRGGQCAVVLCGGWERELWILNSEFWIVGRVGQMGQIGRGENFELWIVGQAASLRQRGNYIGNILVVGNVSDVLLKAQQLNY